MMNVLYSVADADARLDPAPGVLVEINSTSHRLVGIHISNIQLHNQVLKHTHLIEYKTLCGNNCT